MFILNRFKEIDPILIEQIQYCHFEKPGEQSEEMTLEEEIMNLQGKSLSAIGDAVHELCVKMDRAVRDRIEGMFKDGVDNELE